MFKLKAYIHNTRKMFEERESFHFTNKTFPSFSSYNTIEISSSQWFQVPAVINPLRNYIWYLSEIKSVFGNCVRSFLLRLVPTEDNSGVSAYQSWKIIPKLFNGVTLLLYSYIFSSCF